MKDLRAAEYQAAPTPELCKGKLCLDPPGAHGIVGVQKRDKCAFRCFDSQAPRAIRTDMIAVQNVQSAVLAIIGKSGAGIVSRSIVPNDHFDVSVRRLQGRVDGAANVPRVIEAGDYDRNKRSRFAGLVHDLVGHSLAIPHAGREAKPGTAGATNGAWSKKDQSGRGRGTQIVSSVRGRITFPPVGQQATDNPGTANSQLSRVPKS